MGFTFERLKIPDLVLIEPEVFSDKRGFFVETYKYPDFSASGIDASFVQDCLSLSVKKGIIRGLHYQKAPMEQGKLVWVSSGEIFDIAVDIRRGSPYYGKWVSVVLSAENKKMLYILPGFAHGFCALSDMSVVLYKYTRVYSEEHYRGILWNDPAIGIDWPVKDPIISDKDAKLPVLEEADNNFVYQS